MENEIRRAQSARVNKYPQLQTRSAGTLGWPEQLPVGSGGAALVAVMQSADLTHRHDGPHCGRLNRSWIGGVFPQRQMGPGSVVIINIRRKYSPQ